MKPFQATKKPITLEAIQWTGENLRELIDFTGKAERFNEWFPTWDDYVRHVKNDNLTFKIITLEGVMLASVGDYIIKGVQGECYPCKPDIFKATYNYRCKCGEDISFESVGCIYCKN